MSRFDEALALLGDLVAREPLNAEAHNSYNDLLYRLGREEEFLASYDCSPTSTVLQMGKANLLLHAGRGPQAHAVYADILAREPDNLDAAAGAAVQSLEQVWARHQGDLKLTNGLAIAALQDGDPGKAAAMAEKCLLLSPYDQLSIAVLGAAWRMMGDERDETLNGYDDLIGIFDLDPPEGFADMESFNAELSAYLEQIQPTTREFPSHALKGGSQTRGHLFGAGHALVEHLKRHIAETVNRYIAELSPDSAHPFRARRCAGFRFTASWSSRLRDCGYHPNHVHPHGWISSCYYANVPDVVADAETKQGWLKFGQSSYETSVGVRRTIQPAPGRLVLFPSYMWHGTVPFRSDTARTTISFDAVPR
jgi:tetratricopeptide (TPR) repeat protein